MKFSECWLREWVNPAISSEILSDQMTMAGLTVNNIVPVAGQFRGVIVGEVIACKKHPSSEKLRVTKVKISGNRPLNIICGAKNCRVGLKVAVATVGAILPGNLKIRVIKLRSLLSEGMLCSFSELGMSNNHYDIIELPEDAPIGIDICKYLKLHDNTIEISVTPNRADCLSIIGVARDISVLNKIALTKPDLSPVISTINTTIPIRVDEPQGCPRYLGRIVKGLNLKTTTPFWIGEKLRRSGMCSVGVVLDVMNYVLLELGQPINVFDLNCIEGGIVVRMAEDGEQLTYVDGNTVQVSPDTLIIADDCKVLAMAGVFSDIHAVANIETQDILIECAFFNPIFIAGRSSRQRLKTDASHRYERGVDPELQYKAINRVTRLLIDICGGQAAPVIDVTNKKKLPKREIIELKRKKIDHLLGYIVESEKVSEILDWLGFKVKRQGESWFVVAPSWRFDIEISENLVAEVARIHGYLNIPNIPIRADLLILPHSEAILSLECAKTLLVNLGFQEVITYSFIDPKIQSLLHPGKEAVVLLHPISSNMSVMRQSLWTGLLSAVLHNEHRQQASIRFFESGLRFLPDTSIDLGVRQDVMLGGVIAGHFDSKHWDKTPKPLDFYDLKGSLESIFELTGKLSEIKFETTDHPALHPGQSAVINFNGDQIGIIGMIHPELEYKFGLHGRTLVFELEWDKVARCIIPNVREISRFPENRRDIAVVVAENISVEEILLECRKVEVNRVVSVNLFDVYRGQGVPEGYKSLAISLVLQDIRRTLTEEEIATTVSKCIEALTRKFQASLRD